MENPISYAKHHKYIMGVLVFIVIAATAVGSRLGGKQTVTDSGTQLTRVSVASAQEFLRDRGAISANGTVESLEQAELRSQASAPVAKIYVQIGQKVQAGQTLVALKNNDISAQVAQAQALYNAAQARLDELKKGARTEQIALLETKVNATKQALADTKAQQDTAVSNAYTALLNVGLTPTPSSGNTGTDVPTVTGSYKGTEQGQYKISIYAAGDGIHFQFSGLENGGGLVSTAPVPLGTKGLYIQFGSLSPTINNSWTVDLPNTKAAGYTATNSAYLSAQQGRDTAVNGATAAASAAQQELDLALAGATNEQIKAQQAAVDQARANVAAAAAMLDKTVIKSPIAGTVSALPVKYGELVSPGSLVASVVNKGGLQVKAYISDYDLPYVQEGAEAVINDNIKGKVARLSPSINPLTKNVEIQVAVDDAENSGLVVGQNASIKVNAKQLEASTGPVFLLPLQAVAVGSGGASVFTVNGDSVLEEHKVALGATVGEKVEVKEGLTPDMKIVTTVYELKNGQKVSVE